LLLESTPIGAHSARERVRAIIQRYLDEEPHLIERRSKRFKVPRFLLNDIVRFWRTMAVDFASKQRDRGGSGWGLRNAKLRMSRKLIFVSGLLACFSCNLDEQLQTKIRIDSDECDEKSARRLNLAHLENHILEYVRSTPLDFAARAALAYGIQAEVAKDFFSAYDDFLGLVADPEKRKHLKTLTAQNSREDVVFGQVRDFSDRFAGAVDQIFFKNANLKLLTQKYGVF